MKIMISQPMRGKTEEQIRTEREELVKKLTKEGHEVVDTIFGDYPCGKHSKNTPVHYLAKSIEFIGEVDAVIFMQGWENARGCRIEEQCAREYGKFIRYE